MNDQSVQNRKNRKSERLVKLFLHPFAENFPHIKKKTAKAQKQEQKTNQAQARQFHPIRKYRGNKTNQI